MQTSRPAARKQSRYVAKPQPIITKEPSKIRFNIADPDTALKGYTMPVFGRQTPYPHKQISIDASLLREKLMGTLDLMSRKFSTVSSIYSQDSASSIPTIYLLSSFYKRNIDPSEMVPFDHKRRKFDVAEFTIAKQRLMSEKLHLPGAKIKAPLRYGMESDDEISTYGSEHSRLSMISFKTL